MNQTVNIGLDLGMGAIKLYASDKSSVFPSFVSVATGQEFSSGPELTTSKVTKLSFDDTQYYVGRNAHQHGNPLQNLDYDRLLSGPEIKALFYGAMTDAFGKKGIPPHVSVIAGMPIETLKGSEAQKTSAKLKKWLVGNHKWQMGRDKLSVTVEDAKITNQAAGALFDYLLDDGGQVVNDPKQEIGILSIGFNTTEILVIDNQKTNQRLSNGDTHGVRRLLELCNPENYTLGELDAKRMTGVLDLKNNVEIWASEVKGAIERTWGTNWKRFDRLIMVGGGSIILRNHLPFDGKAIFPNDPILSIARGLWKLSQKG